MVITDKTIKLNLPVHFSANDCFVSGMITDIDYKKNNVTITANPYKSHTKYFSNYKIYNFTTVTSPVTGKQEYLFTASFRNKNNKIWLCADLLYNYPVAPINLFNRPISVRLSTNMAYAGQIVFLKKTRMFESRLFEIVSINGCSIQYQNLNTGVISYSYGAWKDFHKLNRRSLMIFIDSEKLRLHPCKRCGVKSVKNNGCLCEKCNLLAF